MVDKIRVTVYVFAGMAITGFLAGFTDGMMGYTGIIGGGIMWIGLIGLGITSIIRYKKIKQFQKEAKSTPI